MIRGWLRLIVVVGAIALTVRSAPGQEPEVPSDQAGGLVERTRVELLLLEVEAIDSEGRPLRGLRPEEIAVKIDGRDWPVASVDDFCRCAGPSGSADAVTETDQTPETVPQTGLSLPADSDAGRFVLYFDLGQLRLGGRSLAIQEAGEWIRKVKGDADEVMMAAYITRTGVIKLCDFTSDRDRLLDVLDRTYRDRGLVDQWAVALNIRLEECETHPTTCIDFARQEYTHGRQALAGLRGFLEMLALEPGRKTVIYFHENGMMDPGVIYGGADTPTLVQMAETIGAEATAARAVVYPLLAGLGSPTPAMEREVLGLGAVLAEATGGEYNRGGSDFARVADGAGRGCRCRYLIGLDPPPAESGRVLAVSIVARGIRLPHLYRVRLRSGTDRWLRRASAILESPAAAHDVPVQAAILPVRVDLKTWDVAVQVAIDARELLAIPRGPRQEAGWEVGARLQRLEGTGRWEMLGVSQGNLGSGPVPDATILHTREIRGLRPGRYRLAAFVRDRLAGVFGGAEAVLELPDPKRGGVAGPVLLRADRPRVISSLPLVKGSKSADPPGDSMDGRRDRGPAPAGDAPARRGELLTFESWVCPAGEGDRPIPARFISHDDQPVYRPGDPRVATIGPCRRIVDEVSTAPLVAGRYGYVLRRGASTESGADLGMPFIVVERDNAIP